MFKLLWCQAGVMKWTPKALGCVIDRFNAEVVLDDVWPILSTFVHLRMSFSQVKRDSRAIGQGIIRARKSRSHVHAEPSLST